MFTLKNYDVPIDLLVHVILKHISYFELDHVLPCFRLTPKEAAKIKYKIYTNRLQITKLHYGTEYRVEDKLHRENGSAMEDHKGGKAWFIDGKLHRTDGPAVETSGTKEWFIHGKRHRVDGPAVEWSSGYKAWFIDGVHVPEF